MTLKRFVIQPFKLFKPTDVNKIGTNMYHWQFVPHVERLLVLFIPHVLWNALVSLCSLEKVHRMMKILLTANWQHDLLCPVALNNQSINLLTFIQLAMNDPMNEFKLAFTSNVFRYCTVVPFLEKTIWRHSTCVQKFQFILHKCNFTNLVVNKNLITRWSFLKPWSETNGTWLV